MREDRIIKKLEQIDGRLHTMEGRQDGMSDKLYDMDRYLREEVATKAELRATENRLMNHIDGLYKKTDTHDQEITANRSRTERLETRVSTIENRLGTA